MSDKLSEYLIDKGSILKQQGSELVAQCLFCDDKKAHMYVNDNKGCFYCHKCGEAGNIWRLKAHFGELDINKYGTVEYKRPEKDTVEKYQNGLTDKGKEYLNRVRGFTDNTIREFHLGQYKDYIAIPFYKDDTIVNYKYRSIEGKEFQRFKDGETVLFNADKVDKTQDIIVTEGEFDAIACHQLGHKNVISVTGGAMSFKPEWIDFFDSCSGTFYVAFDNDGKGGEGAEKLSQKIGRHRTRKMKLPLKDMNDCLMAGFKTKDVDTWKTEAEEYKLPHLLHVKELYQRLDDVFQKKDRGTGIKLQGWDDFNTKLGGMRKTEITTLTGDTSSGKSTYALNIFYSLLNQDEGVLIASSEMDTEEVVKALFCIHKRKLFFKFTEEDYAECVLWFAHKPLYFVDIHGRLSIGQIQDYVEYAHRKYDVNFVLLDHLHFFIRQKTNSMVQDIENFIFDLVALARKTATNIWLVAHPAKLNNDKGIVHMNDIKHSSAIKQDSHNVITIWRDRQAEENGANEVVVNLEKVRNIAGTGGKKRYTFDPDSLTYKENIFDGEQDTERTGRYYRGQ